MHEKLLKHANLQWSPPESVIDLVVISVSWSRALLGFRIIVQTGSIECYVCILVMQSNDMFQFRENVRMGYKITNSSLSNPQIPKIGDLRAMKFQGVCNQMHILLNWWHGLVHVCFGSMICGFSTVITMVRIVSFPPLKSMIHCLSIVGLMIQVISPIRLMFHTIFGIGLVIWCYLPLDHLCWMNDLTSRAIPPSDGLLIPIFQ